MAIETASTANFFQKTLLLGLKHKTERKIKDLDKGSGIYGTT